MESRAFRNGVASPSDSLRAWREQILSWVLRGIAFFGTFGALGGVKLRLSEGRLDYVALYLVGYGALLVAAFVPRLGFVPRAMIMLGVLYAIAVSGLVLQGLATTGWIFLFAAVALTTILFDLRRGVGVLLLATATSLFVGVAFALGWLEASEPAFAGTLSGWLTNTAILVGLATATVISMTFLIRRLERSVETSADLVISLEQRVRERELTQEALQASEARLLEAQRVAGIGSFEWNAGRRTLWLSDEMYRLLGRERAADKPGFEILLDQIHPEDQDRVATAVAGWRAGHEPSALECRIVRRDDSTRQVRVQARLERAAGADPGRFLGTIQDITEARELEQQLRQSQELEAVGRLAGGVAHDFNNLLTVITGYGQSLLADLGGEPQEAAREICLAGERASELTRQLLAFSRRQFLQPRILDLNGVVCEFEGMLRRLVGEDVECELSLDPSLGRVLADAGQIQRILLNLSLNARDAMPQGGRLTIRTCEVDSLPDAVGIAAGPDAVRQVRLSVADDGCGMNPETRARIFEPFFTTKGAGGGTGLGLSTVYGIVKQSEGEIRVQSAPGRGTTVEIYLPRIDMLDEPATADAEEPETEHAGAETILVVEDEEAVRRMTCRALERSGYRILEAAEGTEALAIARRHQGSLDLVLTDLIMPGLGGVALVERLLAERPGIGVLFMSGYAHSGDWAVSELPAEAALLEKPFGPREVTRKVRQTLDG